MIRIAALVVTFLTAAPLAAWEVKLDKPQGWKSMYCVDVPHVGTQCRDTGSLHSGDKKLRGNEHAEITDHMLWSISDELGKRFGVHACVTEEQADQNCPLLVDLNASHLRRNTLDGTSVAGDLQNTALEERRLAPLAMWSSVPDYGFTVYDWINKMKLCPALPMSAQHRNLCHDYGAWLGGALNSTHFGWLPMRIYNHLHSIALNLAERARTFRETLQVASLELPAGLVWHREYVEEMELLALIYEAVGQHYVADRWATGHMMSRWGPSTYARLPKKNGEVQLTDAVQFGILTGMLHGSQAVFQKPDPLNGPLLYNTASGGLLDLFTGNWNRSDSGTLTTWRYAKDNALSPIEQTQGGIGDLMFDALIKKSYSGVEGAPVDPAISLASATNQRKGLVYCTTQGLRHVIGTLGEYGAGYGIDEIRLPDPSQAEMEFEAVPGAEPLGKNPADDVLCDSMWVTNDSWYTGLRTIAGQQTIVGDIIVVATSTDGAPPGWTPPGSSLMRAGKAYVEARARALKQVKEDQLTRTDDNGVVHYGTELARDSPSFESGGFSWKGNFQEPVPDYFEPTDLDDLDELDNQFGRDKAAVYGLFNKAGVKYWCEKLPETLLELREKVRTEAPADRDRLLATCTYLATRAYRAVDPAYGTDGPRYEAIGAHLPKDDPIKFGTEYEPICRWFESGELTFKTDDASDDSKPYLLSPGYVETAGDFADYGPKSIENWCASKPVMNIEFVDGFDTTDTLNTLSTRWIEIRGHNLGIKTPSGEVGTVEAKNDDGVWVSLEIFNEETMEAGQGWSIDGEVLYARLPLSGEKFTSHATVGQNPEQLYLTRAKPYEIRLTRPLDPDAEPLFMADGEQSVGLYHVAAQPVVLEVQFAPATAGTISLRGEFCHPQWLRPQLTELSKGLFRKTGDTYTPLAVPYVWSDQLAWPPDPTIACDEEKSGVEIANPDPQVFDGNVVFVLSYH